ncbi:hypothetical protein Lal_00046356 [Lupinus albus]|nr:hypothetical protein Lal_00046356 [Lupinus albus]
MILKIGDEKVFEPNDCSTEVHIPEELLIFDFDNPIEAIVSSTYPNLQDHYTNNEFLRWREIFASTIETVNQINDYALITIPPKTYIFLTICSTFYIIYVLNSYSVDISNAIESEAFNVITLEFPKPHSISRLSNHKIKLKIGTPIMLLKDYTGYTRITNHVLEANIMSNKKIGNIIYFSNANVSFVSMVIQAYQKIIPYHCFICFDYK